VSRYRDLGHLEGDEPAVADDLGADLDQPLAPAVQRPRLRRLGHRRRPDEVAKVVASVQLEAEHVGIRSNGSSVLSWHGPLRLDGPPPGGPGRGEHDNGGKIMITYRRSVSPQCGDGAASTTKSSSTGAAHGALLSYLTR